MNAPPNDYILFWTSLLSSLFGAFLILIFFLAWMVMALIAIGGMRQRTWQHILYAFAFSPLVLGLVLKNKL